MKDIQILIASLIIMLIISGLAWVLNRITDIDWLTCMVLIGFFTIFAQLLRQGKSK